MMHPLQRLEDNSERTVAGHLMCSLESVRIGTGVVRAARAYWRLTKGPIPHTHTIVQTCGVPGCIATEHHKLEPLAKPKRARTHCFACGRPFASPED